MIILAIDWGNTLDVVGFGFGMVFIILIILVLVLTWFSKAVAPKVRVAKIRNNKNQAIENKSEPEFIEDHLSAGYSAAIALALHLYYSDVHDEETAIITIKTVEKRYSPWSSKIYGINNLVR